MFTNLREFVINPKFAAAISIFVELSIAISALVNEIHSKAEKTVLIVLALAIPVMWAVYLIVKNFKEEYGEDKDARWKTCNSYARSVDEEEIVFTEGEAKAVYGYAARVTNGKILSKTEILTDITLAPFKNGGLTRYAIMQDETPIFWLSENTSGLLFNYSSDGELTHALAGPLELVLIFKLPQTKDAKMNQPKAVKFSIYTERTCSTIHSTRIFITPSDDYVNALKQNDTFADAGVKDEVAK